SAAITLLLAFWFVLTVFVRSETFTHLLLDPFEHATILVFPAAKWFAEKRDPTVNDASFRRSRWERSAILLGVVVALQQRVRTRSEKHVWQGVRETVVGRRHDGEGNQNRRWYGNVCSSMLRGLESWRPGRGTLLKIRVSIYF